MKLLVAASLAALMAIPSVEAHAKGDDGVDLEVIAALPGSEVTRRTEGDAEILEIRRAGVVFTRVRRGDKVQTLSEDRTGLGAVACVWHLQVAIKSFLDVCFPDQHQDIKAEVSNAIDQINEFIIANSLAHDTQAGLDAAISAEAAKARTAISNIPADQVKERCELSHMASALKWFERTTRESRDQSIKELLSVPRPPVINPCI